METHIVSEALKVRPDVVYEFVRRMDNLPRWASGLAGGISQVNGAWFAESPMGRVKVTMAPTNAFGVLDHDVMLADGSTVHNAFRVTPAGEGSLLAFVLVRGSGVDTAAFQQDVAHVAGDLKTLKTLLEASPSSGEQSCNS
jgi:hypothetical protein